MTLCTFQSTTCHYLSADLWDAAHPHVNVHLKDLQIRSKSLANAPLFIAATSQKAKLLYTYYWDMTHQ